MLKQDLARSIDDLYHTGLSPRLRECEVTVMGIYGRKDSIVSPKQGIALRKGVDEHTVHYFEQSGHFPMPGETEHSHQTVLDFPPESE